MHKKTRYLIVAVLLRSIKAGRIRPQNGGDWVQARLTAHIPSKSFCIGLEVAGTSRSLPTSKRFVRR